MLFIDVISAPISGEASEMYSAIRLKHARKMRAYHYWSMIALAAVRALTTIITGSRPTLR